MEQLVQLITEQGIEGLGRYYSIYRGIVTKRDDPLGKCRIKVCVPEVNGIILWAETKGHHGALNTGFKYITPKIGDIVWVEFEDGDLSKPVWTYHSWASGEVPIALQDPDVMGIVTPNGNIITLDESDNHLDVYIKGDIAIYSDKPLNLSSGQLVRVNGGTNNGVININQLTEKLNKLVKELENLKTAYNTHTHSGVSSGPGTTAPPVQPYNNTFSNFNEEDYEDTKFTH